jgi:hypothetical protein
MQWKPASHRRRILQFEKPQHSQRIHARCAMLTASGLLVRAKAPPRHVATPGDGAISQGASAGHNNQEQNMSRAFLLAGALAAGFLTFGVAHASPATGTIDGLNLSRGSQGTIQVHYRRCHKHCWRHRHHWHCKRVCHW